ncbi:MAG: hypothetical protein J0H66_05755 [Solirubrobacterales bacterium]|nr:hypothetical protein [Solirubrobacterales bacterium]OJU95043.1 MAG: hypothetical protein BGO23_07780 [Solirubrobacterales bacterium 67-14]
MATSGSRPTRLYEPRSVDVACDANHAPIQVNDVDVVQIREEWVVEDGWWTARPIKRWYFEVVLIDGRDLTLYRDFSAGQGIAGTWFAQRA